MTTRRPSWPLSEAAELTGVSRSTLRRHREQGRFPNAYKDSSGTWKVPLEDLLAAGLRPVDPALADQGTGDEPEHPRATSTETAAVPAPGGSAAAERVRELEAQLAAERARADGLERVAALAEANAADLRMALRMLGAGTSAQREQAQPEQVSRLSEQGMSGAGEQETVAAGPTPRIAAPGHDEQAQPEQVSRLSEQGEPVHPEQGRKRWWDRLRAR